MMGRSWNSGVRLRKGFLSFGFITLRDFRDWYSIILQGSGHLLPCLQVLKRSGTPDEQRCAKMIMPVRYPRLKGSPAAVRLLST